MDSFTVQIIGCGSALPTPQHAPSAQYISYRNRGYLIDCGEGTQLQLRKRGINLNTIHHILLSHLHGDHCLGLIGLISTMGLLGRRQALTVYAHPDAEPIFRPQLDYFCRELPFAVHFHAVMPQKRATILEEHGMRISSIPLKHRVPTCGFLFEELPGDRHMIGEMVAFYNIPHYLIPAIKRGADFTTESGLIIPNEQLTRPAHPPRKYAYCSDTLYSERILPDIEGVDLLYHEATFAQSEEARAKKTYHSTAKQAATIARMACVQKLLLGHFSARYKTLDLLLEEARSVFANAHLAKEGSIHSIE